MPVFTLGPTPPIEEMATSLEMRGGEFVGVSLVPAPRCERCYKTMEPEGDIHWKCTTRGCTGYNEPIHTGTYPLREVK